MSQTDDFGAAGELLTAAWGAIATAAHSTDSTERYQAANVAALRAAAAVLSARATRRTSSTQLPSAWTLLAQVAPELGEWSDFFAANAAIGLAHGSRSVLIEPLRVSDRQADDLVRDAERFICEVRTVLLRDRTRSAASRRPAADG